MKLLLDTHAFLWFVSGDEKLSTKARLAIENVENDRFLGIASLWEIAIKNSLGRLELGIPIPDLVNSHVIGNSIGLLQIKPEHLEYLRALPFHHRDPFDRLILAQCFQEQMILLSRDEIFDQYGEIERYW
ncbi:MAG TPA: type II toxin-antitoxin system VapC family toxin [bacterium]|nr:type II toxin-antitoxin system VapC family toxin [bacterium]